jgi:myo-inositol-1(or 4)-monophosphatase
MNVLETVTSVVKSAGAILAHEFRHIKKFDTKGDHDIVTHADYQSEALIMKELQIAYPEYSIITEESPNIEGKTEYCWYIDPLDGTNNFITGSPYFVVSIGLAYQHEIILGVVYNPISDELFYAEKGKGAFLNGERISVSERNEISGSLLALAYAPEEEAIRQGLALLETFVLKCRRVVINFAPALDLCNIARGRIDGLIDNGSTPEDHAAASLILSEAGGSLRNFDQAGWDVNRTGIIASNGRLQDQMLSLQNKNLR